MRQTLSDCQKRVESMRKQQQRVVPVWRDISRFIAPHRGWFDFDEPNQGKVRNHLLDSTPLRSLNILQAGMQSGLTPPSRTWFKLEADDPELASVHSVAEWMDDTRDRILMAVNQSNINNCLHGLYGEVATFGIGALLIEEDEEHILHGRLMTAGEYFVGFGDNDAPNAFARIFHMTAGQMAAKFGEDALSDSARRAAADNRPDDWYKVRHLICEDTEGKTHFPYMSLYWEEGRTDRELHLGGYNEFPVIVPRWNIISAEPYGYGPGWEALGEAKTLQELRRDYLIAQKKLIDPPVQAPAGARNQRVRTGPGAVNLVTTEVPYRPIYQVNPDINGQLLAIRQSQDMIERLFYSDLFQMIASIDNPNMTATEVTVRQEEKLMMLGPVVERLEFEALTPAIGRVFGIMNRRSLFPEPPAELKGRNAEIKYVSMLALAQRTSGMSDIRSLLALVEGLARMNPDTIDKLNTDNVVDEFVRGSTLPAKLIREDEEVAAIRGQRGAARESQRAMDEARGMADIVRQGAGAARDLSAAPDAGSVMDSVLGGQAQA